jgi:hypothetical protein
MTLALADTANMPIWDSEADAPGGFYVWGTYTALGPFQPDWSASPVSVQERRDHHGRHNVKARWGSLRCWARNTARELGDFMVGSFQPIGRVA